MPFVISYIPITRYLKDALGPDVAKWTDTRRLVSPFKNMLPVLPEAPTGVIWAENGVPLKAGIVAPTGKLTDIVPLPPVPDVPHLSSIPEANRVQPGLA